MDYKAILLEILNKNVNKEGMAKDLALLILIPLLKEAALKTETGIDDLVVAEICKYIESKI